MREPRLHNWRVELEINKRKQPLVVRTMGRHDGFTLYIWQRDGQEERLAAEFQGTAHADGTLLLEMETGRDGEIDPVTIMETCR